MSIAAAAQWDVRLHDPLALCAQSGPGFFSIASLKRHNGVCCCCCLYHCLSHATTCARRNALLFTYSRHSVAHCTADATLVHGGKRDDNARRHHWLSCRRKNPNKEKREKPRPISAASSWLSLCLPCSLQPATHPSFAKRAQSLNVACGELCSQSLTYSVFAGRV